MELMISPTIISVTQSRSHPWVFPIGRKNHRSLSPLVVQRAGTAGEEERGELAASHNFPPVVYIFRALITGVSQEHGGSHGRQAKKPNENCRRVGFLSSSRGDRFTLVPESGDMVPPAPLGLVKGGGGDLDLHAPARGQWRPRPSNRLATGFWLGHSGC